MKPHQRTILLTPGPVTMTDRVRRALLQKDLCHREPEYSRLQTDVRERLTRVYAGTAEDYVTTLLTGSGTAAVESMVGSLIPRDGRALVVANGIYGERIASILQTQGKEFDLIPSEWVEPIDVAAAERKLGDGGQFTHVVTVHHETTTGRLNDLAALGELCRSRGVPMLIDAVSSFGGEAIDFAAWNVEGCAATANKCLHGVPGVSFVLVRREVFAERESGSQSVYLDLFRNCEEQAGGYPTFTPAVQVVAALGEALAELEEAGGWQRRHDHYAALSRKLRDELRGEGLGLLLGDERHYSVVLSSFLLPNGLAFADLYQELKDAGFVIYAGQKSLNRSIFRVAVMGDLTLDHIGSFIQELARVVRRAAKPLPHEIHHVQHSIPSRPAPSITMPHNFFSAANVKTFRQQGYLFVRGMYGEPEILRLRAWVDELLALPEAPCKYMKYYEESLLTPGERVLSRIENFCPYHEGFKSLVNGEEMLGRVSELFGEPSVLFKEKINFKMPGGNGFAAHQDMQAGWGAYASLFITVLIAVDECTFENGSLEIAGGYNRRGLVGSLWEPLTDMEMRGMEFAQLLAKPGDAVFFDSYAPHRSGPNLTPNPRRVLYLTYNRAGEGDHRERYYADKRKSYPPDIEREPGKQYVFKV